MQISESSGEWNSLFWSTLFVWSKMVQETNASYSYRSIDNWENASIFRDSFCTCQSVQIESKYQVSWCHEWNNFYCAYKITKLPTTYYSFTIICPRLLLVVRNPVTRAISDYTQSSSKNKNMKKFEELSFLNGSSIVDTSYGAVKIGVYAKYLERWLKYFPLKQFLIVSGERLVSDPAAELYRVQDFLNLKRVISEKHFYFNSTKGFPCLIKSESSPQPHCLVRMILSFYVFLMKL